MSESVTILADHVRVTGPSAISGDVSIVFKTGEYITGLISKLLSFNGGLIKVIVSRGEH